MTKVFIHGNPETAAIWGPVIAELASRGVDDAVTVSPPGFGSSVPAGWGATSTEYVDWLIAEIDSLGSPVDIVAHDWGAGHLYGLLARRPDMVGSWIADCVGLLHPDYTWHDAAQGWQAEGLGEQIVEALVQMSEDDFAAAFVALGMTDPIAREVKRAVDTDMARCILALYRSAAQPRMAELGARVAAARPPFGTVVVADGDHYAGTVAMMEQMAARLGARTARMPGCGHWWMIEQPTRAADMLIEHWGIAANGGRAQPAG
jgi:pimeloyl-ACP methyl ester carboxylesterase